MEDVHGKLVGINWYRHTPSPIIMVQWKMGASKMTGLSPFGDPFPLNHDYGRKGSMWN